MIKNKIRTDGRAPLFCRLTYKEKRKQFSIGLFVIPEEWNSKKQEISSINRHNTLSNTQIDLVKSDLSQSFLILKVKRANFDVDDIYLQYRGESIKTDKSLLQVFDLHNDRMKKLIGVEYSKATYSKFVEAKNHLRNFIKLEYKKQDYLLSDLTLKFIQDFDYYLKSVKNQKQITINKSIQRLRKIVKLALASGYLITDPFLLFRPKKVINQVVFLSQEELNKLEDYQFHISKHTKVRDLFVFCCYTGLAYAEMRALKSEHIKIGFDKGQWISMYRKKTGRSINIPLLPTAKMVLNKYSESEFVLPIISNQKLNSYLKEIAEIVGIEKRLTHHTARKTFASTVLLFNDVPMEIVSELLGHSSMKITQEHYGKIVQKKVSEEMKKLKNKLTS
jgi:integrase